MAPSVREKCKKTCGVCGGAEGATTGGGAGGEAGKTFFRDRQAGRL